MTKTKKILCVALAVLLIAGAVFFAVYNKTGKKYDYGKIKDYSKYITIGEVEGLSFFVDDCEIEEPGEPQLRAKIAENMRALIKDDDKKVTDSAAVVGPYDTVYVYYYGTYEGEGGKTVTFVSGARMDKNNPTAFYVESGKDSQYFADQLNGKSPNPDGFTLKATGAEGDDSVIEAGDIVCINYTWARYKYQADGVTPDESTKQTNTTVEPSRGTSELLLDLAHVSDYFPAGFADGFLGKKVGSLDTMVFDQIPIDLGESEGVVNFRYEYTVVVNRVIGNYDSIDIPYRFADDAEEKDPDGNALKGKDVVFHVLIASFDNAPDFTSTYPSDPADDTSEQISVLLADDKLNFDATDYYKENVKSETEWLAAEENAGKTSDDYIAYLRGEYEAYVMKGLRDSYDDERMKVAAKPLWEKINEQATVAGLPKRAKNLTKNDLLSLFKYVFNNGTFTREEKTISFRTYYGSFKKFMNACYTDENVYAQCGLDANDAYLTAIDAYAENPNPKPYGECIDAAVAEIVTNKLLIYALYEKLGDAVKIDEAEFEAQRSLMYMYYYYGLSDTLLPDSSLRESMMFDNVMQYLYDHAEVQWESDGATP